MKKLAKEKIEQLALKIRSEAGLNPTEPIHTKTLLRKLGVMVVYRPLSEKACGLSMRSTDGSGKFMLINSNNSRGRQHFTICHELFHLYYDEEPKPHICGTPGMEKDAAEINANAFASALLLPQEGVLQSVPSEEIVNSRITTATMLRMEQLFGVSHQSLCYRLRHLNLISEDELQKHLSESKDIQEIAADYGYDLSLYKSGNEGVAIGDFGEKARLLFEQERISEGHYVELLNLLK
ncbi:MAG: ImmA/IrrE family metallo-endopeptidase [Prevotella sp.]|nr:ImmA/IrrE family metallo-endopeptidase [Prevotella sp.]